MNHLRVNHQTTLSPVANIAPCTLCGQPLRFFIGGYGETLELCDTRGCDGHTPHRPIASGLALKPYARKSRAKVKA